MSDAQIHGADRVATATLRFPSETHRQEWAKDGYYPPDLLRLPHGEYPISSMEYLALMGHDGTCKKFEGYACTNLGRIVGWFKNDGFGSAPYGMPNGQPAGGSYYTITSARAALTLEQCEMIRMIGKLPAVTANNNEQRHQAYSNCRRLWPHMVDTFRLYTSYVLEPMEVALRRERARLKAEQLAMLAAEEEEDRRIAADLETRKQARQEAKALLTEQKEGVPGGPNV